MRGIMTVGALSCIALGSACRKAPEPSGPEASASSRALATQPSPAAPSPVSSVSPPVEITWVDPPALRRVAPKSAMRKASYEVPRAKGDSDDGELAVFYFGPGQGGGIEANVDRWVKQFSNVSPADVKRADREANGLRQHTVDILVPLQNVDELFFDE